jgi:hypothetical protein
MCWIAGYRCYFTANGTPNKYQPPITTTNPIMVSQPVDDLIAALCRLLALEAIQIKKLAINANIKPDNIVDPYRNEVIQTYWSVVSIDI